MKELGFTRLQDIKLWITVNKFPCENFYKTDNYTTSHGSFLEGKMGFYKDSDSYKFKFYRYSNKSKTNAPKPLKIGDKIYRSITHASNALGTSNPTLNRCVKNGILFKGMKVEYYQETI